MGLPIDDEPREPRKKKYATPLDAPGPMTAAPAPPGAMPGGPALAAPAPLMVGGPPLPPGGPGAPPAGTAAPPPIAADSAAEPAGYNNPGAMLPSLLGGGPGSGGITSALTAAMLKSPTAADSAREFGDFRRSFPGAQQRSSQFVPLGMDAPGYNPAIGGMFVPESDAQMQDRSLKAFEALDKIAGGSERMALDKYLGVGGLGVSAGQLGVGERAQQLAELKGAHDIAMDRQGAKAFDLMAAQGKTPDEIKAAMKARAGFFPPGAGMPPGWTPGAPFGPGAASGRAVGGGPGAAPIGTGAAPPRNSPAEYDPSEHIPMQALAEINQLKAKGGGSINDAAKILARHMDQPGMEGSLPHMMRFLENNYGSRALTSFMQPSPAKIITQRFGNIFGAPSEDEEVASKLRNANGLAPKAVIRPAQWLNDSILGGWLGLNK